jgi:hypothetical protein
MHVWTLCFGCFVISIAATYIITINTHHFLDKLVLINCNYNLVLLLIAWNYTTFVIKLRIYALKNRNEIISFPRKLMGVNKRPSDEKEVAVKGFEIFNTHWEHGVGGGAVNVIWSHEILHKPPSFVAGWSLLLILNIQDIQGTDTGLGIIPKMFRCFPQHRKANTKQCNIISHNVSILEKLKLGLFL